MGLFALFAVGSTLLWLYYSPGTPAPWLQDHMTFINRWSTQLITMMCLEGAIVGFFLAMTGVIRDLDDELVFQMVRGPGVRPASYPIGLILVLINFFSFYLAAVIYVIMGLVQESLSKSVIRALGAVFAITLALSIVYASIGGTQVLFFGGNLVLPALLIGWAIGDMCRPGW
jgi:hypothetical protein